MRSVKVVVRLKKKPKDFWEKIINVKDWDSLIKFVKKIHIKEQVSEGATFHDITAILWLPVKIKHTITKIVPHQKFHMEAEMLFSTGIMYQQINIKEEKDFTEVSIEIKFKIYFFLFDLIFGKILQSRLKIMLIETLKKLRDDLGGEIISE